MHIGLHAWLHRLESTHRKLQKKTHTHTPTHTHASAHTPHLHNVDTLSFPVRGLSPIHIRLCTFQSVKRTGMCLDSKNYKMPHHKTSVTPWHTYAHIILYIHARWNPFTDPHVSNKLLTQPFPPPKSHRHTQIILTHRLTPIAQIFYNKLIPAQEHTHTHTHVRTYVRAKHLQR
jgi:hypothetical protein